MAEIKKHLLVSKVIPQLNAIGAKFHIVFDGEYYGEALPQPPRKRGPSKYPHGELRKFVTPHLTDMEIGDVRVVPTASFHKHTVQSAICNAMCKLYGASNYTTHAIENGIETMRIQ